MGSGRSTSATPTAAIGFDFISARIVAPPLLGGRPQPYGLRSGRGRVRYLRFPAAQQFDLGGVDISVAWPAPHWSTTSRADHLSAIKRQGEMTLSMIET